MLNLPGHGGCNCEGPTRRELLRVGSIAMMGLSLPHFFFWRDGAHAAAVSSGTSGKCGLAPAADETASMSSSAERRRGTAWGKLSRSPAFHSLVAIDA